MPERDLWIEVRSAVMMLLIDQPIDFETRVLIAEDAARDVKESVEHEIRRQS